MRDDRTDGPGMNRRPTMCSSEEDQTLRTTSSSGMKRLRTSSHYESRSSLLAKYRMSTCEEVKSEWQAGNRGIPEWEYMYCGIPWNILMTLQRSHLFFLWKCLIKVFNPVKYVGHRTEGKVAQLSYHAYIVHDNFSKLLSCSLEAMWSSSSIIIQAASRDGRGLLGGRSQHKMADFVMEW